MAATTTEELDIKQRFEELCLGLNLDDSSGREAWDTFERISVNYTLEVGCEGDAVTNCVTFSIFKSLSCLHGVAYELFDLPWFSTFHSRPD